MCYTGSNRIPCSILLAKNTTLQLIETVKKGTVIIVTAHAENVQLKPVHTIGERNRVRVSLTRRRDSSTVELVDKHGLRK